MNLVETSKNILVACLDVRAGEKVLVVTDDNKLEIGTALYQAASQLGALPLLMTMPPMKVNGEEPPAPVAAAMKEADVVLCPTTRSLTHTNARIAAAKAGARIATMPNITADMFEKGAMTADYTKVEALTTRLTALLDEARQAKIVKDGCTLLIDLEGRKGVPSTGVYKKPGQSGNLPSGEAYIAPLENGSNGQMIIDGSMVGLGKLSSPLKVTLENGKLTRIEGEGSDKLGILLENEQNATLCELGIGTNEEAILCGIILEDEKLMGTVHIAFGTNTSFGGTNKAGCHMDGIILQPDLYLDEKQVIHAGQFVL